MVKFRAKHVCTPGARRVKIQSWKRQVNKVKVVAVEKLPIDYVPEIKIKKRKSIDPAKYAVSDKVAKSSQVSKGTNIPRITITCGGYQQTRNTSERAYQDAIAMISDASIPISHI